MRSRTWMIFLAVGMTASAAAVALGPTVQIAVALPIGFVAVAVGLRVARRSPQPIRGTWTLYSVGGFGCILASIVQAVTEAVGIHTFPGPSHLIYAVSYSMLVVATYRMGSIRGSSRNIAAHVDGLIMAIGASTVTWSLVLWPYMTNTTHPLVKQLVNVFFSVLTILLLAATTRLAVGPGVRSTTYYFLAAAVGMVFATDIAATLASVNGTRSALSLVLTPFIYTLYGAVSLHPEMPRLFEPPGDQVFRLTQKRLYLMAAGLLVIPGLLVYSEVAHHPIGLPILAISAGCMAVVVLIRFRLLVQAQERAVELQRIQREANADLAAASSRHAMHRATLRAVVRLAGDLPELRVSIAQIAGQSLRVLDAIGHDAEAAVGTSIALDRVPDPIVDGLARIHGASVDGTAPIDLGASHAPPYGVSILVAPLSSQHDLSGALIITAKSLPSSTLRGSVETLASTVSLALESAALTENLLRRRSERRFRALVENSSDIVLVVDAERQITFASPAAHRLLGLPEKALLQSHPARWVHPDDWPTLARVLDGTPSVPHGDSDEVEVRIRHVDGSYRWFEIRTRDLSHDSEIQGLVVTAREITDRKATEQQLAANEARFRALVQSSTDVVAVLGDKGCFTYVSPAVIEMLGYQPEELQGTPAMALLSPSTIDDFQTTYPELSQRLPAGGLSIRRVEAHLHHRNGELRTVDVTVTDMRNEPAVGGIVLNARDITVRKALEADLRFQALHDTLTGLANRTMFTQHTAASIRDRAPDATVGALFIDLDDFKTVNDSLGHAVGDQLLQEVSSRLVTALNPADLAARLGGDEFAVLVVDSPDEGGVVSVAEAVLAIVAQPYRIQGREIRVTASIGIAFVDEDGCDAEVLLRSADVAMYLAKDRGKNRHAVFEAHMHTSVFERLELKADLVRALDEGDQLRCFYQPIVSLQTGRITGVEALVRWVHPTRGLLSPDAFIPLAEDTGLVVPLGKWVLREACQQLRSWQLKLPVTASMTMSVNLSVRQLAHETIVRDVRDAIEDAALDPSTVTLEITETTLMADAEAARRRLEELHRLGVGIAVDDFGTGYSSLQYVQRFPIDIIKIDRSFVVGLGTNPGDGAVVQSMIELSQRLGVHTVAEGIDRPEQVTLLQSLGADLGQGYLFSKPVPASGIDSLIDASPNDAPRFSMH